METYFVILYTYARNQQILGLVKEQSGADFFLRSLEPLLPTGGTFELELHSVLTDCDNFTLSRDKYEKLLRTVIFKNLKTINTTEAPLERYTVKIMYRARHRLWTESRSLDSFTDDKLVIYTLANTRLEAQKKALESVKYCEDYSKIIEEEIRL